MNAEVEKVEGLPQPPGFWAAGKKGKKGKAIRKGKKVKAVRKGKKAGEDDGRLGESQQPMEVTGPKGKARRSRCLRNKVRVSSS